MNYCLVLPNFKIVKLQFLVTVDNDVSCLLDGFPEMTPGRKMFFVLSMFDTQRENKRYSICQIVQNNDLPAGLLNSFLQAKMT